MDEDKFRKFYNKKSIFRQASSLDLSFVPQKLPCRDEILKSLIFWFRPIIDEKRAASSLLITGGSGVGKTVTTRYFGKNLSTIALEKNINVFIEYFNCINFRTKPKIVRELLGKYTLGSGRGFGDEEALKQILAKLKQENGFMLIILDEVHLMKTEEIWAFLDLSETFGTQNARISLLLISRDKDWEWIENERLLSRLGNRVRLRPYSFEECLEIVKYRSDLAFKDGAIEEKALELIARHVDKEENMRVGMKILKKCGSLADQRGLDKITFDLIDEITDDDLNLLF